MKPTESLKLYKLLELASRCRASDQQFLKMMQLARKREDEILRKKQKQKTQITLDTHNHETT
jgi:hypothetical protein